MRTNHRWERFSDFANGTSSQGYVVVLARYYFIYADVLIGHAVELQGKSLREILEQVPGMERVGNGGALNAQVLQITFDSRQVGPGTLFVALAGARHDGHDFLQAAADAGAVGVLVDHDRIGQIDFEALGCSVLAVENTRAILGRVASSFYNSPTRELGVVGITGTNGKTTTSYLLEAIFAASGRKNGVVGTINYRWGTRVLPAANTTPESLVVHDLMARMAADDVSDVIMEVSSHGLSTHRLNGVLFDVGVFTNLTQDHLDFHGSMEAYSAAKRRLFLEHLPAAADAGKKPVAVINVDDGEGRTLAEMVDESGRVRCVRYAIGAGITNYDGADVYCTAIEQGIDGMELQIQTPLGLLELKTGMLGEFNVSNCLAAVAAAIARDVNLAAICEGLGNIAGVPGRLERVRLADEEGAGLPAVFVDFAHTPDALERALLTLRPLVRGNLVVVFGCGGDRDRQKRPVMGGVAARLADCVWVTSDNPRSEDPQAIVTDILGGMLDCTNVRHDVDRRQAIAEAIAEAGDEDVVLIAGKGHEKYQEIQGKQFVFDDVEEARNALQGRRS